MEIEKNGCAAVTLLPPVIQVLLAGCLTQRLNQPAVIIVPDRTTATTAAEDARMLFSGVPVLIFSTGDLRMINQLQETAGPLMVVAPQPELVAPAPDWNREGLRQEIQRNMEMALESLIDWLTEHGYERVDMVTEPGEYAARGGIVDIFPDGADLPVRLEFADNVIISVREFEPLTQRSRQERQDVVFYSRRVDCLSAVPAFRLLPANAILIGDEKPAGGFRQIFTTTALAGAIDLGYQPAPSYFGNFSLLRQELEAGVQSYTIVAVSEHHRRRLEEVLGTDAEYLVGRLSAGFVSERQRWVVLTEREIYGSPVKRLVRRRFRGVPVDNLLALRPGDYVVHIDYGVGKFTGLRRLNYYGMEKDYLVIQYADDTRVYVPVEHLGLVDRYIGVDDEAPKLDRLGGTAWRRAKFRAVKASAEYAEELVESRARRLLVRTEPLPVDSRLMAELEASFAYEETPDQLRAITDVEQDLMRGMPMDRLVCGDVGFGKTEVALRAAFRVALNCRQVALLVPTTVLCYQHWRNFSRRLERFPLRVEMLSRFTPRERQNEIIEGLRQGVVDIVIGTQVLLNSRVKFKNLGLLIIDEEQRFGVRQKEKIRRLRADVHVLTLSATPIPRTLYMALAGLMDISPIHTPPPGRREVLTDIAEWDDELIRSYVYRELNRQGQVFFVHNEIATLNQVRRRLERILPDVRLVVAHGRLASRELAEIYLDFAAGKYQVLLSTAIIESGLDLPNVNTIIVNQAERFGLADLHQLRGRVGRSVEQAYALLIISSRRELTVAARKRLTVIAACTQPGAGYRLALRDMEIRGVGNLLGTEQHGHIARVGFNLYTRMLNEAITRLKGEEPIIEPRLKLNISAYIPDTYIPDALQRLAVYKRLLSVETLAELDDLEQELIDRFGRYPGVVANLLQVARVRIRCQERKILAVTIADAQTTLVFAERTITLAGGLDSLLDFLNQPRG
ncbi:MAG: transcription-repair coupling factor [bacterium]